MQGATERIRRLSFKNVEIEANSAGSIRNAGNRTFTGTRIQTSGGSRVTVTGSRGVTGLVEK